MEKAPTHLDLFSGIGGFAIAARWAGFRTIGFCEIDKYCQKVLAKNFGAKVLADTGHGGKSEGTRKAGRSTEQRSPERGESGQGGKTLADTEELQRDGGEHHARSNSEGKGQISESGNGNRNARIYGNIFDLNGRDFAGVSLITGGFPCQPFSVAGKRRGAADDRAIWPQMFRVISEARPAFVLAENVPGIIAMELDNVLSDLEGIGYATRAFVIPACAVDARHRRDRLWIVGRNISDSKQHGCGEDGKRRSMGGVGEGGQNDAVSVTQSGSGVPYTNQQRLERRQETGSDGGIRAQSDDQLANGLHSESEPGGEGHTVWLPEPAVGRVAARLPSAVDESIIEYGLEHRSHQEAFAAIDSHRREILREMWSEWHQIEPPSHRPERNFGDDSMHKVSCRRAYDRWKLGQRFKENKTLHDLWERILSLPFQETQDMQCDLLKHFRQDERNEKMASRVDRLKGLGNSIVPQVAYEILLQIRLTMETQCVTSEK